MERGVIGILDLRRDPRAGVALPVFAVAEVPFLVEEELEARSFLNCSLFIVEGVWIERVKV
jgi:hypothetical protein